MKLYQVIGGSHEERGITFYKGERFVSPSDLVSLFPGSFQELRDATTLEIASAGLSEAPTGGFTPVTVEGVPLEEFWQRVLFAGYTGALTGVTSLVFNVPTTSQGFDLEAGANLVSVSAPDLTTITGNGYIYINSLPALETIDFPLLTTSGAGAPVISQCPLLETINLPELIDPNGLSFSSNESLTAINLDSWVPRNAGTFNFSGNALPAAVVNALLARCVANAAFVSGILQLHEGTNAAPTGQGLLDVATLRDRGVTVNVNGEG